ncbi:uncharacterized protein F5891DRAFT_1132056 [Suillus fuscotomentosus]|uniref:DUF6830 domain-containing protein n=1 Tax=Suillus fuscotomentosus TaxID=1912939 RepID=A0AAD4DPA5_9AGAM|nr:uncharacterized protein F5891DRAFT_1132056 [Suillus fuscotomentosus]KAG1887913.1 hypothetical protein F5891DRAFT_1132056 [Suillus fuscotomentosus]
MAADDLHDLHTSSYEAGDDVHMYDFGNEGGTFERASGERTRDEDRDAEPPVAFEHGYTFLSLFDSDENSIYRKTNLYYLFSSRREWQIAAWLLHSGLSMGKIDSFLALEMIQDLRLSFHSAKELRGRAETLPSGPRWKSQVICTSHDTKSPVVLYWWDPIDCISNLFNHPLFHNRMDLTSRKVYTTARKLSRVYTEWMMGDHAWEMQSALPCGATLLGTVLSSDKTCITALTGDRVTHPLLLSLANIHMNTRLKLSSNAFVLTALLPKKRMKGVLQDRLIHQCLDIVLEPLKSATREGVMLATTLAQLDVVHSCADQNDIEAFFRESQKFRLNGVTKPFWSDWVLVDPDRFLTPESLHSEIDFLFSILQPTTGYRHFHEGISKLKQVTGRCHRDIQRSIIAVCADAAPSGIIVAVRALMHFHYLIQSPHINDHDICRISAALDEFHANKHAIISTGVRRGKSRTVIDNCSGVMGQWSADVTEHAHITVVKDPARSSNNNNYDPQICRHLDQDEFANEDDETDSDVDDTPAGLPSTSRQPGQPRPTTNYFVIAKMLQQREMGSVPVPLRTFVIGRTAFHLAYDPSIRSITLDEVAIKFGLPDLRPAMADYLHREVTYSNHIHSIGGPRRAGHNAELPFHKVQVWFKVRLQETEFHDICDICPAQTLNCVPPSDPWTFGRYDNVIIQTSTEHSWPASSLTDQFVAYVQCFDISSERDPTTQLHLRAPVNLIPRFGAAADKRLTPYNSMEHATEFWLNYFWDKNTFFVLSS